MKKLALLLPILALAACDRPQYDIQMVCEDGAKGDLLVDAKVYKSHADLIVKRLDKELREKARNQDNMWLADHTWLYNQIPQIDDQIQVSLPVKGNDTYELPGKIKLELGHDNLTGGLGFILWHAADNNLTMKDGSKIPNGQYMMGTPCDLVFEPIDVMQENISAESKNCLNYVSSQIIMDNTPTEKRIRVYDEKTGREMYIGQDAINKIFNGVETNHFIFVNARYYSEDVKQACDVATRLREYIAAHIDTDYIPENPNTVRVSAGEEMTITCGDEEIVVRGE